MRAADDVFGRVAPLGQGLVFTLLHNFGFAGEGSHQQQAGAFKQPGGGVDDFQWHAKQVVALGQDRLGIAGGEGAGQVVGKHQHHCARSQAGNPWTVFGPGENRQEGADDHHECAAESIAEDQAVEGEAQFRQRFIAGTRCRALSQQMLVRRLDGRKQPRP
ncbi:hypothetical protein D3C81_1561290 [compost metagenome]